MSDSLPQEHRSRVAVSLKPTATRGADRPLVLGVFSFRDDAHLELGLIENIGPMVDGWVSYDDRSSASPFGDERLRRMTLLEAAVEHGAVWALAVDPAERVESARRAGLQTDDSDRHLRAEVSETLPPRACRPRPGPGRGPGRYER